MSKIPPMSAVRAFEAAARHQSFTRAAEELGMTQAAVSYQIRLLEDRVGAPLFVRKPREVTLTPVGRRLATPVTKAMKALAAAFADAAGQGDRVLTITTSPTIAGTWLPPRLASFQAAHPEFEVRLQATEAVVDLAEGGIDIGLRSGFGDWPGLVAERLMPVQYTPVASPDLRDRLDLRTPADLARARLLGADDPWWGRWFAAAGVPAERKAQLPTLSLGAQTMEARAAEAGHGVAMVTPLFFQEELKSGRLVQLFDLIAVDERSMFIVYPRERRRARKIKLFRDFLLGEAAEA